MTTRTPLAPPKRPLPSRRLPRRPRRRLSWPRLATFLPALGLALVATGPPPPPEPIVLAPEGEGEVVLRSWREAARQVEEDRRERVGSRAVVSVPPELRHYDDRRRFLAVQAAESREQELDVPQDEADLVALARSGELVEMSAVGEAYVLYGVGAHATGEAFGHYDRQSRVDVPLYPDYLAFERADQAFDEAVRELHDRRDRLRALRARLSPRAAARRRSLAAEASTLDRTADGLIRQQERAAVFYEDYQSRRMLAGKLRLLQEASRVLGPTPYNLHEASGRRAFRGRLLSFIRPEARSLILELAEGYQQIFGRPLPVTSLVRSQSYQDDLRRTNRNATALEPPPHASGLAFDVYTGLMTATEQAYLLDTVARLEGAGRVEALFERNRDHIHVFAFVDGARPAETLIAQSLAQVKPATPRRAAARVKAPRPAALAAGRPALPTLAVR